MNPQKAYIAELTEVAREFLDARIPFCLIRFPNEEKTTLYLYSGKTSKDSGVHLTVNGWELSKSTRTYRPYEPGSDFPDTCHSTTCSAEQSKETQFADYQEQFNKYKTAFADENLQKAILSRVKNVATSARFDALAFFEKLEKNYRGALVYALLHPEEGLWIGASPEVLLRYSNKKYRTVSLAGTQAKSQKPYQWAEKEIEEQEFVSRHIREKLEKFEAENIRESGPRTTEAGSVAHLCSTFEFTTRKAPEDAAKIIAQLHPTPAIAGLPVKNAVDLIDRTEAHDRRLYTGLIGRKSTNRLDYYVNLRCMQVFENSVSLYLGGGITAASELESEWEETNKKSKTLLKWMDA